MDNNEKNIWKPIKFNKSWAKADTSKFDDLAISLHHYGYEDDVIAVGSFMEFTETIDDTEDKKFIPINIEPFTLSLEILGARTKENLNSYIHDVVKIGLTILTNEIN